MSVLEPRTVETKSGPSKKPGGRPWTVYKWTFSDDSRGSTFDQKVSSFLTENIGKPVNVELVRTDKGTDIVSAWPLNGSEPPAPIKFSSEKKSSDDYMRPRNPGESRTIAKQACLKAAVEFMASHGSHNERCDGTVESLLGIADRFVEWVFQENGVRHIKGASVADAQKELDAIKTDHPADENVKAMVVSLIPTATADAKAVLHNYSLKTVKDVQERLTAHVAELFFEANGGTPNQVPF